MHMCLWVNSRKMQNDTGNSAVEIFNRVTLFRLVLKDTKNNSRINVCGLREASSSIDLTASDSVPPFQKVCFNKL